MCSFSRTGVKKDAGVQVHISHSQYSHHTIETLFKSLSFDLYTEIIYCCLVPQGPRCAASVFSPASHLPAQNEQLAHSFSPSLNCILGFPPSIHLVELHLDNCKGLSLRGTRKTSCAKAIHPLTARFLCTTSIPYWRFSPCCRNIKHI